MKNHWVGEMIKDIYKKILLIHWHGGTEELKTIEIYFISVWE